MQEAKEFYNYLKLPYYDISSGLPTSEAIMSTLKLFFIVFALEIFFLFPLMALIGGENLPHALESLQDTIPPMVMLLIVVIVAPFAEELMFRFPLKNIYLFELLMNIFFGTVLYMVLGSFLAIEYTIGIIVCAILIRLAYFMQHVQDRFKRHSYRTRFKNYFPYFFYGVAMFFAWVHLFNWDISVDKWWMTPVLVSPQLILGLLLGYVRMKYGIWYSILVHALNNAIPMMALILFKDFI